MSKAFERQHNPLRCYHCGNKNPDKLRVSNDVVKRRRKKRHDATSKKYDTVAVDCTVCGHQFYSTNPDAIAKSRKLDKNLARRHKTTS